MEMEINFGGGKRVSASYKSFTFPTDQPPDYGGEGTAPEPVDYFFASIGTCTAHTVLSFCESRQIPPEEVRVSLHLEYEGKRVRKIRQEIRLPGDFPEKYRKALVRATGLCTVKRYLDNPPEIETEAIQEGP